MSQVTEKCFVSFLADLHTLGTKKQSISIFQQIFIFTRAISFDFFKLLYRKIFYLTNVKIFAFELELQTLSRRHDKRFDHQNKNIIVAGFLVFGLSQKKSSSTDVHALFGPLNGRRKILTGQILSSFMEKYIMLWMESSKRSF